MREKYRRRPEHALSPRFSIAVAARLQERPVAERPADFRGDADAPGPEAAISGRRRDIHHYVMERGMNTELPAQIEALFLRCPALCGFSVRGLEELPDNYPRSPDPGSELYVDDVGVSPALNDEQFGEIFREIAAALGELLAEKPEAGEALRGRTFARVLH
jgi:hypothetical protein